MNENTAARWNGGIVRGTVPGNSLIITVQVQTVLLEHSAVLLYCVAKTCHQVQWAFLRKAPCQQVPVLCGVICILSNWTLTVLLYCGQNVPPSTWTFPIELKFSSVFFGRIVINIFLF